MSAEDPYFHIFVPSVDSLHKRCSVSKFKEHLERYFERRKGKWVYKETHTDLSSFRPVYPILVYAATYGQTDLIKLLVEDFECDVNVAAMPTKQSKLHYKRTALHTAVICGHVETAAILLRLGADVRIKDGAGMTPIDLLESRAALNSLGQACSYNEVKEYDATDEQVETRKREGRHVRVNPNFSESERAEMRKLLQAGQRVSVDLRQAAATAVGAVAPVIAGGGGAVQAQGGEEAGSESLHGGGPLGPGFPSAMLEALPGSLGTEASGDGAGPVLAGAGPFWPRILPMEANEGGTGPLDAEASPFRPRIRPMEASEGGTGPLDAEAGPFGPRIRPVPARAPLDSDGCRDANPPPAQDRR